MTDLKPGLFTAHRVIYFCLPLIYLFLVSCSGSDPGTGFDMKKIVPTAQSGWKLLEGHEQYDRESIFDYINGAGEVYRSYSFVDVNVFKYSKPDNPEITIEIFDMGTGEDAYGIFSYTREAEQTGIGNGYEYRGSLLSFWKNRYYVCVGSRRETEEAKEAVFDLARVVANELPRGGDKPALLGRMPHEHLEFESCRYFHVHPSLNYFYYLSPDNVLKLTTNSNAVLAPVRGGGYLLLIEYPSVERAEQACFSFRDIYLTDANPFGSGKTEQGKWLDCHQQSEFVAVALDFKDQEDARRMVAHAAEQIKPPHKGVK